MAGWAGEWVARTLASTTSGHALTAPGLSAAVCVTCPALCRAALHCASCCSPPPPLCRAARALDMLMKELCVPLGTYIKGFPPPSRLHPFERALLELTVGPGTYERVLARVEALRRSTVEVRLAGWLSEAGPQGAWGCRVGPGPRSAGNIRCCCRATAVAAAGSGSRSHVHCCVSGWHVQVGKAYATRASRATNKRDAIALQEEGFASLQAVFTRGSYAGGSGLQWGTARL